MESSLENFMKQMHYVMYVKIIVVYIVLRNCLYVPTQLPSCRSKYPYLLTPLSRVLLEKLTGFQLLKKFPAFYGTQRFITAFTTARHLSLS